MGHLLPSKDDEACGRRRRKWGRNIGKHTKHGAIA